MLGDPLLVIGHGVRRGARRVRMVGAAADLAGDAVGERAGELGGHAREPSGHQLLDPVTGVLHPVAGVASLVVEGDPLRLQPVERDGRVEATAGGGQRESQRLVTDGAGSDALQGGHPLGQLRGQLVGADAGVLQVVLGLLEQQPIGSQLAP